jgi:hypothetical protein
MEDAESMLGRLDEGSSVTRQRRHWTPELAKHPNDHRERHRRGVARKRDDLMMLGPTAITPLRFDSLRRQQDQELVVVVIVLVRFDHPGQMPW